MIEARDWAAQFRRTLYSRSVPWVFAVGLSWRRLSVCRLFAHDNEPAGEILRRQAASPGGDATVNSFLSARSDSVFDRACVGDQRGLAERVAAASVQVYEYGSRTSVSATRGVLPSLQSDAGRFRRRRFNTLLGSPQLSNAGQASRVTRWVAAISGFVVCAS